MDEWKDAQLIADQAAELMRKDEENAALKMQICGWRESLEAAKARFERAEDAFLVLLAEIDDHLPQYELDYGTGDEASELERVAYAGKELSETKAELAALRERARLCMSNRVELGGCPALQEEK